MIQSHFDRWGVKGSIELKNLFTKKNIFDNPKPTDFLNRLMVVSTNPNDIILDFFAGSSSTAHSVMKLNLDGGGRKFILIQIPQITDEKSEANKSGYKTITELGKERIRRAGKKIAEENPDKIKQYRRNAYLKQKEKKKQKELKIKIMK